MQDRAPAMRVPVRRGFSLVELIGVMLILGVLALSAAPAARSMTSARQGVMSRQLVRLLELARAHATATGQPTGLVYDNAGGAFQLRRIASSGAAPTPVLNPLGVAYKDLLLAVEYPSVAVISFTTGNGDPVNQSIWFSFNGTPEIRSAKGVFVSEFTQDAVVTTTGNHTVTIRMSTGAIAG